MGEVSTWQATATWDFWQVLHTGSECVAEWRQHVSQVFIATWGSQQCTQKLCAAACQGSHVVAACQVVTWACWAAWGPCMLGVCCPWAWSTLVLHLWQHERVVWIADYKQHCTVMLTKVQHSMCKGNIHTEHTTPCQCTTWSIVNAQIVSLTHWGAVSNKSFCSMQKPSAEHRQTVQLEEVCTRFDMRTV